MRIGPICHKWREIRSIPGLIALANTLASDYSLAEFHEAGFLHAIANGALVFQR